MNIEALIQKATSMGASDIHLVTGLPPSVRVAGEILMLDGDVLEEGEARELIQGLLSEGQRKEFERELQLCFSTLFHNLAHLRVSIYTRLGRLEAAIRLRSSELRTLEDLGLPPSVAELTRRPNGLVIITGPTGVGKTTTFYSMIDLINRERRTKVITVEDPIEYLHSHKRSIIIQQEIGRDARSFPAALRHILRLDPDVICIGEMRDPETISTALLAAETGHLVIATLHTTSAAQTIERIVTALPETEKSGAALQLANCLRGAITQALLPTVDKKSRALAYEIMLANTAVKNNIRELNLPSLNMAIQSGGDEGMKSMDMCLKELYQSGQITYETAMIYARDPKMIRGEGHKAPGAPL
ncbi:MAG: PilT/PilU family type 4a pilus ATPase [Elusimicrobia bacterium]|nr:PilT/PilU family type 4a pilus ATPase [Elusimicrobiota bacterium]